MKDFTNIIGHEDVILHLQNAIQTGKVSHAYMIYGEDGSGKKTIADIFAAALQCEKQGVNPCGVCKSCLQAASRNQPDIRHVQHEKASIGVDDIKTQVNHDITIKPYCSKYKIYIIPEADKMTEQAQNALLKTIEEPPEYGILLLLTNNIERFLPTILSRCISLHLKAVDTEKIKKYLMEQVMVPDYKAELSAVFAEGSLGKAIRFAGSEEFEQIKSDVLQLMKNIREYELSDIMGTIKSFAQKKEQVLDYFDLILLWYRDILLFKATKNANLILYKEAVSEIKHQASLSSFESLDHVIHALEETKKRLESNVNFEVSLELLLMAMKEL